MGMAEETGKLTGEIMSGFEARAERVTGLRRETAALLKGFRRSLREKAEELREKAAELRRFLSAVEVSRMKEFMAMRKGMQARQRARNEEVRALLGGVRRECRGMASHWRTLVTAMRARAR
jgi:hypothetical protein